MSLPTMSKLISVGLVTFCFAAAAQNPVPTEKVSAEAYALAKLLYTPAQHTQQLEAAMSGTMAQLANKPDIKVNTDKLRAAFAKLLNYQELLDFQAGLLAKYYTSAELTELGRFYGTPLGKKALNLLPQVIQDVMGFVGQLMSRPESQKLLKDALGPVAQTKRPAR